MLSQMLFGLLLPLAGTTVGAAGVFCMRCAPGGRLQRSLDGFAAGVMTAASVWSLLLPAMAQSAHLGRWAFLPAALGIGAGAALLWVLNRVLQPMEQKLAGEGIASPMLLLAVSLHNLPEGMAVGALLAGLAAGTSGVTAAATAALALGVTLTACGDKGNETPGTADTGAEYAIILKTLSNDFWAKMKAGIEEEAKALGVKVDIFAAQSEDDTAGQLTIFENCLTKDYKVIGVAPLSPTNLINGIVQANEKGIYVMNIDEKIDIDTLLTIKL